MNVYTDGPSQTSNAVEASISLGHLNCDAGTCIVCSLELGRCPWCDATETCEHLTDNA